VSQAGGPTWFPLFGSSDGSFITTCKKFRIDSFASLHSFPEHSRRGASRSADNYTTAGHYPLTSSLLNFSTLLFGGSRRGGQDTYRPVTGVMIPDTLTALPREGHRRVPTASKPTKDCATLRF